MYIVFIIVLVDIEGDVAAAPDTIRRIPAQAEPGRIATALQRPPWGHEPGRTKTAHYG